MFSQIIDSVRRLFGSNTDRKRRREREPDPINEGDLGRKRLRRDTEQTESWSSAMADWVMSKKKSFTETYHVHDVVLRNPPQAAEKMRPQIAALDRSTSHVSDQVSFSQSSRSFHLPPRDSTRQMTRPSIRPSHSEGIFHSKYGMQTSHHPLRPSDRTRNHGDHRRPCKLTVNETIKLEDKRKYADLLRSYMSGSQGAPKPVTPQTPSVSVRGRDNTAYSPVCSQPPSQISSSTPRLPPASSTPPVLIDLTQPTLPDTTFNFLKRRRDARVAGGDISVATQGVQEVEKTVLDTTSPSLTDSLFNFSGPREPPRFARTPLSDRHDQTLRSCTNVRRDWLASTRDQTSFDAQEIERRTKQELIKVQDCNAKLAEWEQQLRQRIKKSLRISRRQPVVIEDESSSEEEVDLTELEEGEEEGSTADFIELGDEDEARVSAALSPSPPGQVMVEGYRLQLTRQDLHTLAGLNWLNDEVINFYMNMLMERGEGEGQPRVHAFSTFFYPKLVKMGHAGVRRWTKKVDVFSMDLLLVPVHLGMHWCLAVVDFAQKEVQYYDSMGGQNDQCLNALKNYLSAESVDKKGAPYDTSDWTLLHKQDIPQQMNGSDCGMFTCKFAEYITRRAPINFTQEHMPYFRRRMVLELLTKQLL